MAVVACLQQIFNFLFRTDCIETIVTSLVYWHCIVYRAVSIQHVHVAHSSAAGLLLWAKQVRDICRLLQQRW